MLMSCHEMKVHTPLHAFYLLHIGYSANVKQIVLPTFYMDSFGVIFDDYADI